MRGSESQSGEATTVEQTERPAKSDGEVVLEAGGSQSRLLLFAVCCFIGEGNELDEGFSPRTANLTEAKE